MCNKYLDVINFNEKIIGLNQVDYLDEERLNWFKGVIREELGEFEAANNIFKEAIGNGVDDNKLLELKIDMMDAIIDLVYFALGRLYELGFSNKDFDIMWEAIHNANMNKKKGNKGRGSDTDAIKPLGWQGPEKVFLAYKKALKDKNVSGDGEKFDDNKPNLGLVFGGFSRALLDVAYVGTFGANKYTPSGWKYVSNLQDRYSSALLRHMFAILHKDEFDNETGRHHLAHVAWNALALLEDKFMSNEIPYHLYNENALMRSFATIDSYKAHGGQLN